MAPPTLHSALLAAAIAACGLALPAPRAHAQLLEFAGAELRGRIDRPGLENVWTFGDANGNGALDDDEHFGTQIDVDEAFLEAPGRIAAGSQSSPQGALQPNTRPFTTNFDSEVPRPTPGSGSSTGGNGIVDDLEYLLPIDFDDLVYLPASYDATVSNTFATFGGAQLMHVLRFESDPEFTFTAARETLEVGYGARFISNLQDSRVALLGVLDGMSVNSVVYNQSLGPQLSINWSLRNGPWQARAGAAASLTYMSIEGDQTARMAPWMNVGGYNLPSLLIPRTTTTGLDEWDLSPALEAGVLAGYDLTPSSLVFIRGDAIQFGNIRGVEQAVVWQLPTMGLRDPGGRDVTITAASIGLEVRR